MTGRRRTGSQIALDLTTEERGLLDGDAGPGTATALRVVVALARMLDAPRLLPVTRAHVDSCLYHGRAGLDFAERLVDGGAAVRVPTTLNVGSLDLHRPGSVHLPDDERAAARRLMDAYVALGCRPTWTCAPYQLADRPVRGEHVAWAESNAIVFANAVLGARTERYGDFVDVCAAITGRVPDAGLHRDEGRRGTVVFDLTALPEDLRRHRLVLPLVGHVVGAATGTAVPVVRGLPPDTDEDGCKALGAAAASSGGVALFHAVGVTPEAPTLEAALGGRPAARTVVVTADDLRAARAALTTTDTAELAGVSVGTPHFSVAELRRLAALFAAAGAPSAVPFHVSTGRDVWAAATAAGLDAPLAAAGVTVVRDTCTYITPILPPRPGAVLTDSAKWAYYAPGNVGVEAVLASLEECVTSAVRGRVVLDDVLAVGA